MPNGWDLGSGGIADYYRRIMERGIWSNRDLSDIAGRAVRGVQSGLAADRTQTADRAVALGGTNPWLFGSSQGYTPSLAAYGAGARAMQDARLQNREVSLGAADRYSQLMEFLAQLETIPTQGETPDLIEMLMNMFQQLSGQLI